MGSDTEMVDADADAPGQSLRDIAKQPKTSKERSNGEHKHKHKSKDKTKEKDKEKHKHRSHKDKDKDKSRDRTSGEKQRRHRSSEPEQQADRDAAARQSDDSPPHNSRDERRTAPEPDAAQQPLPPPPAQEAAAERREVPPAEEPHAQGASDLPADYTPQVNDSGGEVSMSIEETNRMRIAMGLKPLKVDGGGGGGSSSRLEREAKEVAADKERKEAAAKKASADELRRKLESAKEKRKMEASLSKVKSLGAAAQDVDDISAWVSRSREAEAEAKRAAQRAAAAKLSSMYDEGDEEHSADEDAAGAAHAAELAGMRVKHSADNIGEGETVILTLKDRNILEEGEDEPEELENVQAAEDRKRKKARELAVKPGHNEYDDDGNKKGLLSKYDEEDEEDGMVIDAGGAAADERARKQAEIRRKLAAGTQSLETGAAAATLDSKSDFYTKEEMAAFTKPKKRVKKKLRKKAAAADEEEAVPSSTTDAIAALEAAAEANAASATDHGSRRDRGAARDAERATAEAAEAKRKKERYEAALAKANYATLAASMADTDAGGGGGEDEEDDDIRAALEESIKRRREAAKKPLGGADAIAEGIIKRREAEQAQSAADTAAGTGERITEAAEFARLVGQRDEGARGAADDAAGSHMGVDDGAASPAAVARVKAEDGAAPMETDGGSDAKPQRQQRYRKPAVKEEEPEEDSISRERLVGTGLAGALSLLKERGELGESKTELARMEWAGRTNDMKPVALQGLETVYQGGRATSAIENSVERALTRRDANGRVLTPKEAFRELCHNFHGIFPSKNKQERQLQKDKEAAAAKRAATSENPESLHRLQRAQKAAAAPYVVLSGSVTPGQTRDATSGFATATGYQTVSGRASVAPIPVLGGGITPLEGDAKVKAMLGLKRPGGKESMPPPAARKPRTS